MREQDALLNELPELVGRGPDSHARRLAMLDANEAENDTAAAQMVAALEQAGVNTYFGLPGGPVMPLFDAILRSPTARLIESRHETNAVFAAVGYWRATGRVPVVVVTAGPGATNAVTGIVSAHLERVPMLVICGDVAWASSGGRMLQAMGREGVGIEEMLNNVTRATVRVARSRSAASQAMAALKAAMAPENPGPALLVLPIDCGAQPAELAQIESIRTAVMSHIEEYVLVDVAQQLAAARRPLIVLGAGCRAHVGVVQRMVEALRVPFMTTPQAKGIISEDHPYSLRNGGMAASWWARRYTQAGIDVALVLGTDLDDVSVGPTPPIGPDGVLIHVDLDPTVFNRTLPTRMGIACDLGPFAKRLREVSRDFGLCNRRASALMAEVTVGSPFDFEDFRSDDTPFITPHRAIHDLEAAAGPHATYITDIGEHMLFALHYLTALGPHSFAIHISLGSMASGICSALGHAIGNPDRRVVCICGDGGMQMAGSELLVAVKLRLPIVYAVFNDARYNMVYHGYKQQFRREAAWESPPIDFITWARALGMPGARIDHPGEITAQLLDQLTEYSLPVVLDIRHDPNVRIRGAGRIESLQHMSAPLPSTLASSRPGTMPPASSRLPLSACIPSNTPVPIAVHVPPTMPPPTLRGALLRPSILPPPPLLPRVGLLPDLSSKPSDK